MATSTAIATDDTPSAPPPENGVDTEFTPSPPVRDAVPAVDPEQWIAYAAHQAVVLKDSVSAAVDSTAAAVSSAVSTTLSASYSALQETKGKMEEMKMQYVIYEDEVVGKIKEGILVAAEHPGLSCGIAASFGIVAFRGPRRLVIRNVRRIFVSEESLISDAEAKVNELRQSINIVKNESLKLEERAFKAKSEIEQGRKKLIEEGHNIRKELRYANRLEREALGLKELVRELPGKAVPRYRSEVSKLLSQVKENKETLSKNITKIVNHGIHV